MDKIIILCLHCGWEFIVETNGHALAMYDKDHSVRWARHGKKLKCPKCERKLLIFKDYLKHYPHLKFKTYGMQMQGSPGT